MKVKVTDEDIEYAESILMAEGYSFDLERRDFIRNLDTIDLQAVPGSGKTTALLAKLLILERYMPFSDGSGVLVISHTNIAVDEIKSKIGRYCPKLFSYPNFVGTIQSFVDQFLAIPYYANLYQKRPYRIDNEIYNNMVTYYHNSRKDNNLNNGFYRRGGIEEILKIRFDNNWNLIPSFGKTSEEFHFKDKNSNTYKAVVKMKRYLFEELGCLHFDDAYLLGNSYIKTFPKIVRLLRKRFQYVFIDEMQDMGKHQVELLEKLFFTGEHSKYCYQRIGDKNQAIFGGEVETDDFWGRDGRESLLLNGSYRLTPETAEAVKYFGLNFQEIEGRRQSCGIKPHILVFENPEDVLPRFVDIIREKGLEGKDVKYPFSALAWISEHSEYLGINDYHPKFDKKHHKAKIDYACLNDYLKYHDVNDTSLASIRNSILNSFIKILRTGNIRDENGRNYTINNFLSFIRESNEVKYEELKLKLFEWAFSIKKGADVYEDLKSFIPPFLNYVFPEVSLSEDVKSFINFKESLMTQNEDVDMENPNYFNKDGIKVKIGTVHSVKGETHTATLFMESYYKGIRGKNGYESERLKPQIEGTQFADTKVNHIKSTKITYVACSRPTHLLCVAIHKDRMDSDFNDDRWEVVTL